MFDRESTNEDIVFRPGNVSAILRTLRGIHAEVDGDEVMAEFGRTITMAIAQLCELRELAHQTMLEIEAEQANSSRRRPRLVALK